MEYLIIDCVGPLPPSKSGSQYALTVMCQATRYPPAFPMRFITARSVVKALTQFMSVFAIPKVVQSDRGTNFTSKLFSQALKQTTSYINKLPFVHSIWDCGVLLFVGPLSQVMTLANAVR